MRVAGNFRPGTLVHLCGLRGSKRLNGAPGVVVARGDDTPADRVVVKLDSGGALQAVLARHLLRVCAAATNPIVLGDSQSGDDAADWTGDAERGPFGEVATLCLFLAALLGLPVCHGIELRLLKVWVGAPPCTWS